MIISSTFNNRFNNFYHYNLNNVSSLIKSKKARSKINCDDHQTAAHSDQYVYDAIRIVFFLFYDCRKGNKKTIPDTKLKLKTDTSQISAGHLALCTTVAARSSQRDS
ncbi:hypothetical protein NQD34_002865 [Periophthalmus magnuspinnatus]|nr:hypothetical protein NQD34_002865 [Periophthalmus magnuspinnatus]